MAQGSPAAAVAALYDAYQARDWEAAEGLLHPAVVVDMPATRERLEGRAEVLNFQRNYPEPWGELSVIRVLGGGRPEDEWAAAEVRVEDPAGRVFLLASFWEVREGRLWRGVEYWVDQEEPPERRHSAGGNGA